MNITNYRITPTLEGYLEAMALEEQKIGVARLGGVAKVLTVKPSSAYTAATALCQKGFIVRKGRGIYRLTEEGKSYIRAMGKRHSVLERFMADQLGLSDQKAQEQACAAEHLLPDEILKPLAEFLTRQEGNYPNPLFGSGLFVLTYPKAELTGKRIRKPLWFELSWALLLARRCLHSTLARSLLR